MFRLEFEQNSIYDNYFPNQLLQYEKRCCRNFITGIILFISTLNGHTGWCYYQYYKNICLFNMQLSRIQYCWPTKVKEFCFFILLFILLHYCLIILISFIISQRISNKIIFNVNCLYFLATISQFCFGHCVIQKFTMILFNALF